MDEDKSEVKIRREWRINPVERVKQSKKKYKRNRQWMKEIMEKENE